MIDQVCAHVHNYFETDPVTGQRLIYPGTYTITNGAIILPFMANGQYFRIFGSRLNDGVYLYPTDDMADETFTGVIWEMRPPRDFLALVEEISAWVDKYGDVMQSPYQSENVIGVYAYAKDGNAGEGWPLVFKRRLDPFRKLF